MEKAKRERIRPATDWITKSKAEIENEEEILACRKIILLIVRYMKENGMNQKELAEKLSVSPQYINRLLHGQDIDLKITTALRYGRILGITLVSIPDDYTLLTAGPDRIQKHRHKTAHEASVV